MVDREYFAEKADFGKERTRMELSQAIYGENSKRNIRRTGIAPGWACVELGAGGGAMTRWLSDEVGEDGRVLAVDLNCRFLQELDAANVEVREADILSAEFEPESFDLLFSRFMLLHIPDRQAALAKMLSVVKPGGWVVLEDADFGTFRALDDNDERAGDFNGCVEREIRYLTESNYIDCYFGRKLYSILRSAGLEEVRAEGFTGVHLGGGPAGKYYELSHNLNRDMYIEAGVVSLAAFDARNRLFMDPTFAFTDATIFAAWGRKSVS